MSSLEVYLGAILVGAYKSSIFHLSPAEDEIDVYSILQAPTHGVTLAVYACNVTLKYKKNELLFYYFYGICITLVN